MVNHLEDLILKMAKNDIDAFESLYTETKASVFGLALSILNRPHDAEDAMQETYIRAYNGAGTYRPKGKPMAWILRITRNIALDKLRHKTETELPLEHEWLPPETTDFTEPALNRILLSAVLVKLSPLEKQIVILHSVAGLKHREIAGLLEIPLSTALSKYHRALSKIRTMLEGE